MRISNVVKKEKIHDRNSREKAHMFKNHIKTTITYLNPVEPLAYDKLGKIWPG